MEPTTLQHLSPGDPVDFEVVVNTAYAERVSADVHTNEEFVVKAKEKLL